MPFRRAIEIRFCLIFGLLLVLGIGGVANAETKPTKRLTVISMPAGSSLHAETARRLLPSAVTGFELLPPPESIGSETMQPYVADTESGTDTAAEGDASVPDESSVAEAAREAALAFDLVAAAELWRRAADTALKSADAVLYPRRVASLLMEAGAAASAANETDLSLTYFRKSIAVDGDILPGPEISPDAKALFQRAVTAGPLLPEAPREEVLEAVWHMTHSDGVIWVAVGIETGEWTVLFKRFIEGEAGGEVETRRYAAALTDAQITAENARFARIAAGTSEIDAPIPPLSPKQVAEGSNKRPWYKKWWFYTALGAVLIAGGAVGVGVWAAKEPDTVDTTLHF